MFKKITKILGWAFLLGIVSFTVAFTTMEAQSVRCDKIEVLYDGPQVISIGNEGIIDILKNIDQSIIGKNINQINSEILEQELKRNPTIETAEVYKSILGEGTRCKGVLTVIVKHRVPVLRVINGDQDYFLDKNGIMIPTSTKYTADVPVATGKIDPAYASEWLVPMVDYIKNDPFWKAQVEQINVQENGELVLIPLVGGQYIEFGKPEDFQDKLANLRAFYEDGDVREKWNKYISLSVKYKDQVIGTKK
jgi:cell division protein FtsQ